MRPSRGAFIAGWKLFPIARRGSWKTDAVGNFCAPRTGQKLLILVTAKCHIYHVKWWLWKWIKKLFTFLYFPSLKVPGSHFVFWPPFVAERKPFKIEISNPVVAYIHSVLIGKILSCTFEYFELHWRSSLELRSHSRWPFVHHSDWHYLEPV